MPEMPVSKERIVGIIGPTGSEDVYEVRADDVVLPELRRAAPAGVKIVDSHCYLPSATKQNLEDYFMTDLEAATERLKPQIPSGSWNDVEVIVQIGTPLVFIHGLDGEQEVKDHIEKVSGRPAVTQMGGMIAGVRALGRRRI